MLRPDHDDGLRRLDLCADRLREEHIVGKEACVPPSRVALGFEIARKLLG